jgi:hypothetical protein
MTQVNSPRIFMGDNGESAAYITGKIINEGEDSDD